MENKEKEELAKKIYNITKTSGVNSQKISEILGISKQQIIEIKNTSNVFLVYVDLTDCIPIKTISINRGVSENYVMSLLSEHPNIIKKRLNHENKTHNEKAAHKAEIRKLIETYSEDRRIYKELDYYNID